MELKTALEIIDTTYTRFTHVEEKQALATLIKHAKTLDKVREGLDHFNDRKNANEHFLFGIETVKEMIDEELKSMIP